MKAGAKEGRTRGSKFLRERARRRRIRMLGVGATVLLLAVGAAAYAVSRPPEHPAVSCVSDRVGDQACDFSLSLANTGGSFNLSSPGGPLMIQFMGSRCTTCERETPRLASVYNDLAPRGLRAVSIDVGGTLGTEDPQVMRDFMQRTGANWDFGLDNQGIGLSYSVISLPTVYVLDGQGRIAFKHTAVSPDQLRSEIESLL